MTDDIAILGCGPSGLLAAHAAAQRGFKPTIYSVKIKSPVGMAQFMHEAIPGASRSSDKEIIAFDKLGTREGYAHKVYGSYDAPCSWDQFPREYMDGWPVRPMYNRLWDMYSDMIVGMMITPDDIPVMRRHHEVVINTIPAQAICTNLSEHRFPRQEIWLADRHPGFEPPDNSMTYNGFMGIEWYRASKLFGVATFEYATRPHWYTDYPSDEGIQWSNGFKPLDTNCDCQPEVHRVGRFGEWRKGVLLHHAYTDAVAIVDDYINTTQQVAHNAV
jgi:hypothetical protein